jgi:hypothetical protein
LQQQVSKILKRLIALVALSVFTLTAQVNTSAVAGLVTDETGSSVPNASLTLTDLDTSATRKATSDQSGEYVFPQLPPGRYKLQIATPGFQGFVVELIQLGIAERARVDAKLRLGAVAETVTVSGAAAPLLEPETASLGQTVSRKAINDLPLNGRNYLTLGALSPGVVPQIPPSQGPASFVGSTTGRSDRSLLVGGQRESSTSYLYDGVEMRNPRVGDSSITPSLDAVQEFKIQRNFFQAEFGNSPGIINVASRGGTNQWHGSVFHFLRNNALDARTFFARSVEPFKRNQFGFALGGPIIRDRFFVFGNFEGFRQRLGITQRGLFPRQNAELAGNFTQNVFADRAPQIIHDPLTFNSATNSRTPFAGNIIPSARFNRVSRNFLPYIPVTNAVASEGVNLIGIPVQRLDDDQINVRGDYRINDQHSLFARYSWQDAPIQPAALQPLGGAQVISRGRAMVAQLTSSLRPNVVNVFRAAYNYAELFGQQVTVDKDIAAEVGITGVSTVQRNWGVPNVGWIGFSGIGSNGLTQGNKLHNYQLSNATTWIKGGHTVKWGYEIRQSRNWNNSDNGPRGSFTFGAPAYTSALDPATGNPVSGSGNPVADFLLGFPLNSSGAVGSSATHFRFYTQNLFVQDDWKVSRELTLNYGLRYEIITPPSPIEQERRNVYGFDFRTGQQLFPTLGQIRNSVVSPDYRNFGPRLGLAYNPTWAPQWVVRAGAGVYFDQAQMNETQFITNGPPVFAQQNINLTGRGLPEVEFGRNALPVVQIPPIDANYQTPQGIFLFAQEIDGRKPRIYMWTMSVQRSLGNKWMAEAAYVGSQGRRLSKRFNSDADSTPGVLYRVTPGVRRFPRLAGMLYSSLSGSSQFHGLNLKVDRRFDNGFSLLAAYTFSKSMDNDSGGAWGTPNLNPANHQLDWAPSDFNIANRFVWSGTYELPIGKGKRLGKDWNRALDATLGGWQLNGIGVLQSGVYRVIGSPNNTGIGFVTQRADSTGLDPYSAFGSVTPREGFGDNNRNLFWFNPNAFRAAAPLTFGNTGRNVIVGPGFVNYDLSLFKTWAFTERYSMRFQFEAFNAFNNVRFNPPDVNVASPTFGRILGALEGRRLQLALRFQF